MVMTNSDGLLKRLDYACKYWSLGGGPPQIVVDATARIRELEARLSGVDAGTHVVVPVEPTEAMYAAGRPLLDADASLTDIYRALLKAVKDE